MICKICNKQFQIINTHGGQNRQVCYDCVPQGLTQSEREKIIRQAIKRKVSDEKLQRGCDICGYNKCAEALEWHHNNDNKNFNPSNCLTGRGFKGYEMYLKEIEKCELLCANCHREKHYGAIV